MTVLFHFMFECIKIILLSTFYTTLVLLLLSKGDYKYVILQVKRLIQLKYVNKIHFSICLLLFVYMFTYYGDHGLGDYARIPLGYKKNIERIDSTTLIKTKKKTHFVHKFYKQNHLVFIQAQPGPLTKQVQYYLVWNLKTDTFKTFESPEFLTEFYNSSFNLNAFKTFWENYSDYWHGWRFWLLP